MTSTNIHAPDGRAHAELEAPARVSATADVDVDDTGALMRIVGPSGETLRLLGKTLGIDAAVRAKGVAQKKYIQAIREHDIVFGIGPAGTGKTYLAMAMAVNALVEKRVKRIILTRPAVEAGEKLGFLPGDLAEKVNPYLRPLYDALHDMMDAEKAAGAHGAGHHRGGAARVHARPHAQRLLRHPRRGAEHHVRADEDVPHPPRLRLEGGGHGRHHAGRPAPGQRSGPERR
jgi:predicted ribonuclease YlaK